MLPPPLPRTPSTYLLHLLFEYFFRKTHFGFQNAKIRAIFFDLVESGFNSGHSRFPGRLLAERNLHRGREWQRNWLQQRDMSLGRCKKRSHTRCRVCINDLPTSLPQLQSCALFLLCGTIASFFGQRFHLVEKMRYELNGNKIK